MARRRGALELSGLFGVGLMAWIVVQWALLSDRLWLQPLIFGIAAVIAALMKPSIGMLRVRTLISAAGQELLHARQLMGIRANLSLCR